MQKIDEKDRSLFVEIVETDSQVAALESSVKDVEQQVELLKLRIKKLLTIKERLEKTKLDVEFEVFPKYSLKPGDNFSITDWELFKDGEAKDESKKSV